MILNCYLQVLTSCLLRIAVPVWHSRTLKTLCLTYHQGQRRRAARWDSRDTHAVGNPEGVSQSANTSCWHSESHRCVCLPARCSPLSFASNSSPSHINNICYTVYMHLFHFDSCIITLTLAAPIVTRMFMAGTLITCCSCGNRWCQ